MPTTARDRLARLLAGTEETHPDSAMTLLSDDALRVQVAGVGDITLPIRAPQAKKLIAVARPASFGRGEETLHDDSVRDTWELAPDQVSLGGDWQRHLDLALADLREDLGLPYGARLRAELHSMLVYGKGQFFLPHQDSEKHDDMVATLVVSLPSVHTGGELVVDDGGRERTYRASRADLVLVAFYADRRHEVRPVGSGYRVTLTFNLMLTTSADAADSGPASALAELLTEHFTTPARSPYGGRDRGAPTRLAFPLDHEYSQRGLAGSRFKGADADRVALLRAAATRAGCELVLALAEIRETRDALPAWRGRRHRYHGEEFEDDWDHQEEDFEVGDLIDDEIALGWWIGPGTSPGERIKLRLDDSEVCAATPSSELTPYESEYEGFMGNYGNTLDRWYRRAAVVLWPKDKAFAARAEADPARALGALLDRIDAGDLAGARADAATLEPFWRDLDPATLRLSLRVALGLRDAATASLVLAPYRLEMLTAEKAAPLAAVITAYGEPWGRALLGSWDAARNYRTDRADWVSGSLASVCRVWPTKARSRSLTSSPTGPGSGCGARPRCG